METGILVAVATIGMAMAVIKMVKRAQKGGLPAGPVSYWQGQSQTWR